MIEITLLRDDERKIPMKLPFFKGKPVEELTLLDLTRAGFESTGVGAGEGDILAKHNLRVLYNPIEDKVIRAYEINHSCKSHSRDLSLSQLEEALHYLEHYHLQNLGCE